MVQIEDEIYAKLKKDADDNRQIVHIVRAVVAVIIFCILFFSWGIRLIDLDIQRRTAELQTQIALTQAETNKQVMTIESEGLTTDEYFKWLNARKTEQERMMEPGFLIPILLLVCIIGIFAAAIVQSLFLLKLLATALMFACGIVLCI